MNLKLQIKDYLAYLIIFSIPIFLGTYYSFFIHDFHHWTYSLSNFYDYKNGLKLFQDIFLQYGAGQIIFFNLISIFFEINMLSIGIITNVIFASNLIFFYLILRKYFSYLITILTILLILLIHPFAHYPWPDYYSGFCITLFFYLFLLNKQNNFLTVLQASLLFLAIFFRTSYLIHIMTSILFFILLDYIYFKQKKFNKLFLFFLIQLFFYLLFLSINGQLLSWFEQGIGAIKIYTYGSNNPYMSSIISYLGEYGWLFLKLIKVTIRWITQIFNIFKISNFIFAIFLVLSFIFFIQILIKKKYRILEYQKYSLILLISLFGLIQGFMIYENFRIINSSIGLFFLGLFFLKIKQLKTNFILMIILPLIYIYFTVKLLIGFPNNSTFIKFEIKDENSFVNSKYEFFSKKKKLSKLVDKYYEDVYKTICNKNLKITNISPDFSIPYICSVEYKKDLSPYWYPKIEKINPKEYFRITNSDLYENEVLITKDPIFDSKIILITKLSSPHEPSVWYGKYLYIYKKK